MTNTLEVRTKSPLHYITITLLGGNFIAMMPAPGDKQYHYIRYLGSDTIPAREKRHVVFYMMHDVWMPSSSHFSEEGIMTSKTFEPDAWISDRSCPWPLIFWEIWIRKDVMSKNVVNRKIVGPVSALIFTIVTSFSDCSGGIFCALSSA